MQSYFILFYSMISLAKGIQDLECTVIDQDPFSFSFGLSIFASSGFGCKNNLGDATCASLFGLPPIEKSDGPDRSPGCFTYSGDPNAPVDQAAKQYAVDNCQATCAYCCVVKPPKCLDKSINIDCTKVTNQMCTDPLWIPIMAEECPGTCDLCDYGDCRDKIDTCKVDVSICWNANFQAFVKENCQKTCSLCPTVYTTTTLSSIIGTPSPGPLCPNAVDSSTSCSTWVKNGFCASTYYTQQDKEQYCAKSCNLCTKPPIVVAPVNPCAYVIDTSASCAVWNQNGFCNSQFYTFDQKKAYCAKTCKIC